MAFDLSSLFKAKAPPLFGLDISSSSVKMLELVDAGKKKGGLRVERGQLGVGEHHHQAESQDRGHGQARQHGEGKEHESKPHLLAA